MVSLVDRAIKNLSGFISPSCRFSIARLLIHVRVINVIHNLWSYKLCKIYHPSISLRARHCFLYHRIFFKIRLLLVLGEKFVFELNSFNAFNANLTVLGYSNNQLLLKWSTILFCASVHNFTITWIGLMFLHNCARWNVEGGRNHDHYQNSDVGINTLFSSWRLWQ